MGPPFPREKRNIVKWKIKTPPRLSPHVSQWPSGWAVMFALIIVEHAMLKWKFCLTTKPSRVPLVHVKHTENGQPPLYELFPCLSPPQRWSIIHSSNQNDCHFHLFTNGHFRRFAVEGGRNVSDFLKSARFCYRGLASRLLALHPSPVAVTGVEVIDALVKLDRWFFEVLR